MEIEKRHLLKSYKNEQEAIDAVNMINDKDVKPATDSQLKEDQPRTEFPSNGYNIELADKENDGPETTESPDPLKNKHIDAERPLPEREINQRLR